MKRKGEKGKVKKKKQKNLQDKGPGGGIGPQAEADTFDISRVWQQDSDISKGGREEGAQRALRGKQREHPHPASLIRIHPASPAARPCVLAATALINGARRAAALPGPAVGGGSTALPPTPNHSGERRPQPAAAGRAARGGHAGIGRTHVHTHTRSRVPARVRTHGHTHIRTCVRTVARAHIRACVHSHSYMRAGCMRARSHTYKAVCTCFVHTAIGTYPRTTAGLCAYTHGDTARTHAPYRAVHIHTHMHLHRRRHVRTHSPTLPHVRTARSAAPFRPAARCRPPHPQRREVDLVQAPRRRVARHVSSAAAGEAAPPPPSWQWRPARR